MKRNLYGLSGLTFVLLFLSACASKEVKPIAAKPLGQEVASAPVESYKDVESFRVTDPEGPKVEDKELEEIPTEINPLVEKWIAYFQGRGRDHMERYLSRSTRYEKLMKKVLRDNGLPEDLFYIALIESGFSSAVTSRAAAVGYWQFIRGTGKRYGLAINQFEDDRRDPVFATQAAAEYFKGLYSIFGSWYLSMASYNVGENRVKKEVMRHYTRDFWELAKKRRLPKETINYVPKFIAAKLIAKEPEKYGFVDVDYLPPIEFDHISVTKAVNLKTMADKLNIPYEDFKALNPKWKGEVAITKNNELTLRVPPELKEIAVQAANDSEANQAQFIADSQDTQSYIVRKGDTIKSIARKYRTNAFFIRDLNDWPRNKKLRVGMKLQVPDRPASMDVAAKKSSKTVAKNENAMTPPKPLLKGDDLNSRVYIVQNGDSLFTIAQKYSTSVSALQKLNNIKKGKLIRVGMRLVLPGGGAGSSAREVSAAKVARKSAKKVVAARMIAKTKERADD